TTLQGTVNAASNSILQGVAISTTGATGYVANTVTNITVLESTVTSNVAAVSINDSSAAAGGVSFTSTTSTGGANGIILDDPLSGTFAFGTGSLSNTSASFLLTNTANHTAVMTYIGSLSPTGAGRPVEIGTAAASTGLRGGSVT